MRPRHARLLILVLGTLSGCAAAAPPPPPAPVVVTKTILVPVPAPAPTTVPVTALPAARVLHDGAAVLSQADHYVGWSKSKTPVINTVWSLSANVQDALAAMKRSRRHGRYGLAEVARARAAVDALGTFLAHVSD